jgi:CheY-like chemotaxis protein
VKSEPQKGTEFTVRLPIAHKAALGTFNRGVFVQPKMPILNVDQETPDETPNLAKEDLPLILLIEDNEDMATYIRSCLPDAYRVMVSTDGDTGIQEALTLIPDIIISDVMMPEKDGFEVCHILKQDERTSHIPIILLTALADPASRLQGLQKGADAYLSKPFSREELIIRIEKLLELRKTLQQHYAARLEQDPIPAISPSEPSLEDLFLDKVNQILENHYEEEEFGNAHLASRLHISESQLFRKLKALTGKSTAVYIRSFRLQKGKELLSTTSFTVAEIAYRVGFSDPAYFSRTFSLEFGTPPNAMRNS